MYYFFVFCFFLLFSSYFVWRITKKGERKEFPIWFLIAFIFKISLGCFYGQYFKTHIPNADTWNYYINGLQLNQSHWNGVFKLNSSKNFDILSTQSYFNYYRYLIMDIFSSVCSLLTGGRYYCNVIIFNFLTFLGLLKFYRFLFNFNPQYKRVFFIFIFFFPPFVFWTSGFHRDGLCMAFLGVYLYLLQKMIKSGKIKYLLTIIISLIILIFLRSFWGFSAIIVGFLWWSTVKFNYSNPSFIFSLGTLFLIGLFALSSIAPPSLNFAHSIVDKQRSFLELKGGSELPITRLTLDVKVYCKALLDGFNHLLLRPYPREIGHPSLYLLAFLENVFIWGLICLACYCRIIGKKMKVISKPENNVLLFLVIINYAVIGLTVPFLGAIVRYKAPFELLLILLLVQFIPLEILRKLVPKRFKTGP